MDFGSRPPSAILEAAGELPVWTQSLAARYPHLCGLSEALGKVSFSVSVFIFNILNLSF